MIIMKIIILIMITLLVLSLVVIIIIMIIEVVVVAVVVSSPSLLRVLSGSAIVFVVNLLLCYVYCVRYCCLYCCYIYIYIYIHIQLRYYVLCHCYISLLFLLWLSCRGVRLRGSWLVRSREESGLPLGLLQSLSSKPHSGKCLRKCYHRNHIQVQVHLKRL